MKKENPRHRWHLTLQDKTKIRRLTLQRVPQATIARIMNLGAPTVSKAQRAMGLPTRIPVPEAEIMKLFEDGWGGYRIAKYLHIAVSAVYKVAHQNNFRRADNVGYPTPLENETRLIEAIKRREDYSKRLAKKYKVGICKTIRLAHEILACPEFRPGASKPVLSSNFPQRHFDVKMATPDQFVELAHRVCQKCFGGKLPAVDDTKFASAIVSALPCLKDEPEIVSESFAAGLVQALVTLRHQQEARWQN